MDAYLPEGLNGYAWAILAVLALASLLALTDIVETNTIDNVFSGGQSKQWTCHTNV